MNTPYLLGGVSKIPSTWREVAEAVEIENRRNIDFKAVRAESIRATFEGGQRPEEPGKKGNKQDRNERAYATVQAQCKYCRVPGHLENVCPTKAAELRGEKEAAVAKHAREGSCCSVCGGKDHSMEHHTYAVEDWVRRAGVKGTPPDQAAAANDKGKGKGKKGNGGGNQNGVPPPPNPHPAPRPGQGQEKERCREGAQCKFLNRPTGNACRFFHPKQEVKAADLKREQAAKAGRGQSSPSDKKRGR